ncbi:MAG: ABC transporter ATP-binding protein [Chloroflexi bacterium]|nr:ABC transporter ATP-binding protein [Chloroflexota bacterium]
MIEIKGLSIQLGDFSLSDINLEVQDREYFVILGPTGAGKTVLIECIAGLRHIQKGEVWLGGVNVTRLPPEERGIGYVPQDYVLFPFLNVAQNIAFGLRRGKRPRQEIADRVDQLSRLLGISSLLERSPRSLSGGEKQRVALARALAPSPRLLLLDEPLSSLDQQTSKRLRLELRRIHQDTGIATVHITHNQAEAEELAGRIAVINRGRIEQVGSPADVFFYPGNQAVSDFIGAPNILECHCCEKLGKGLVEVKCGDLSIVLPHDGRPVRRIALSPRDVYVSDVEPPGPHDVNRFKGIVTGIRLFGASVRVEVSAGSERLLAEMPYDVYEDMDLDIGKEVYLILKLRRIRVHEDKAAR